MPDQNGCHVLYRHLSAGRELRGQFPTHLAVGTVGERNTAGFGNLLQPRGQVHAVAIQVVAVDDHITQIDPDAILDAVLGALLEIGGRDGGLYHNSPFSRVHDARELREQPIADDLDDTAAVFLDLRCDQVLISGLETRVRTGLVDLHEAGVANHVR
jgi:hypothetical protein